MVFWVKRKHPCKIPLSLYDIVVPKYDSGTSGVTHTRVSFIQFCFIIIPFYCTLGIIIIF